MSTCKKIQYLFPEAIKNELNEEMKRSLEQHFDSCARCREEYLKYEKTIDAIKPGTPAQQTTAFYDKIWIGIEQEIKKENTQPGLRWLITWKNWLFSASQKSVVRYALAALILVTGIMIGRLTITPGSPPVSQHKIPGIRAAEVKARSDRYLDRSKMLLLGMVNHDPAERVDFSKQQEISKELIKEAAALKDDLADNKEFLLRELIEDLEIILLQIAYLEKEYDLETVEMIRSGIEKNSLLFKINLEKIEASDYRDNQKDKRNTKT